jgi:hypothetical protein
MPYGTFALRFESCGHTMKIPLQHNSDHDRCFMCHVPASGKMPGVRECSSAHL